MSRSAQEAFLVVQEWSGGPLKDRKARLDIREWSRVPLGCPEVVGKLSRMSRSGREAFPDIREALTNVWEWSGVSPGCPGVF